MDERDSCREVCLQVAPQLGDRWGRVGAWLLFLTSSQGLTLSVLLVHFPWGPGKGTFPAWPSPLPDTRVRAQVELGGPAPFTGPSCLTKYILAYF